MKRILLGMATTCALAACTPEALVISTPPEPIPVAVDAACFEPCAPLAAWPAAADGTAPWAALGELAIEDAAIRDACESRRAHCAAALRRLVQARVIVVTAPKR